MTVGELIEELKRYDTTRQLMYLHLGFQAQGIDRYHAYVSLEDDPKNGLIIRLSRTGQSLEYHWPEKPR